MFLSRSISSAGNEVHISGLAVQGMRESLPLRYDFVGIGEVAVDIFHLERVSITDLVIGAAVVCRLNHDDVAPRAAEIDGVALAGKLPPDQAKGQGSTAECCEGDTQMLSHHNGIWTQVHL